MIRRVVRVLTLALLIFIVEQLLLSWLHVGVPAAEVISFALVVVLVCLLGVWLVMYLFRGSHHPSQGDYYDD